MAGRKPPASTDAGTGKATENADAPAGRGERPNGPTVEQAIYALLFLAALGLRLYGANGMSPLSPWEAAQVLPVWAGQAPTTWGLDLATDQGPPASPLLFTLQRALLFLSGSGTAFWMRFAPACAGAGLVLAAWLLRGAMGRGGALLAALLFALDPWLLAYSRMADGATLSTLTGLLLLGMLFHPRSEGSGATRLGVTGGLFLISGPLAWLMLPIPALALWLLRGGPLRTLDGPQRRRALLAAAVAIAAGSTAFFSDLSGLGAISGSIDHALVQLTGSSGAGAFEAGSASYTTRWGLLRLVVDAPFLVVFGAAGLMTAIAALFGIGQAEAAPAAAADRDDGGPGPAARESFAWLATLASAVCWGLALLVLPGRAPAGLLLLGLPLLLLAAGKAAAMLRLGETPGLHLREGQAPALTAMAILLVTAYFWTGNATTALVNGTLDAGQTAFYLLIPALGAFFAWWCGPRAGAQVFGLLALGALFLAQTSSSWMLNFRPEPGYGRGLHAVTVDGELNHLLDDAARLNSLRLGGGAETPFYLDVDANLLPFFAWHLRDMHGLRALPGLVTSGIEKEAIVVTQRASGEEGSRARLPEGFVGSRYSVARRWLPTELRGPGRLLRWALYREVEEGPHSGIERQEIALWVHGSD